MDRDKLRFILLLIEMGITSLVLVIWLSQHLGVVPILLIWLGYVYFRLVHLWDFYC